MSLFERNGNMAQIPVFNKSEVFDVTGAGDTVVGSLTLALATGTPVVEAAILGNLAASIVVKRFGAATTTPQELSETLDDLDETLLNAIQQTVTS
jgi:bifunctional ADP-heptose synthase (sugar kinase/adenylyltransferase)